MNLWPSLYMLQPTEQPGGLLFSHWILPVFLYFYVLKISFHPLKQSFGNLFFTMYSSNTGKKYENMGSVSRRRNTSFTMCFISYRDKRAETERSVHPPSMKAPLKLNRSFKHTWGNSVCSGLSHAFLPIKMTDRILNEFPNCEKIYMMKQEIMRTCFYYIIKNL